MSQLYSNYCRELQKFLERFYQSLRGVLSQEAEVFFEAVHSKEQNGGRELQQQPRSREEILPVDNDVEEQTKSPPRRKSLLWSGSMDVIIEQYNVADIVSVIDSICETLTGLLDNGYGYRKYYVLLLEALLKLLTAVKDVDRQHPDMLKRNSLCSQLKVSVSITYALVEKVSARPQLSIFVLKFSRLRCAAQDSVPLKFRDQIAETKVLREEVLKYFEFYEEQDKSQELTEDDEHKQLTVYKAESSSQPLSYGINKLTVAARHRRSLILNGEKVSFFIRDFDSKVVYLVQTWLNNPNSIFHRAKRLSALVEAPSKKVFNIGVPGYPNKEADFQNGTALIVSGFEEAQVRTFVPVEEKKTTSSSASGRRKAGALLQEGQPASDSFSNLSGRLKTNCAGELLVHSKAKYQKYRGEIVMSNMLVKLEDCGQMRELSKLTRHRHRQSRNFRAFGHDRRLQRILKKKKLF